MFIESLIRIKFHLENATNNAFSLIGSDGHFEAELPISTYCVCLSAQSWTPLWEVTKIPKYILPQLLFKDLNLYETILDGHKLWTNVLLVLIINSQFKLFNTQHCSTFPLSCVCIKNLWNKHFFQGCQNNKQHQNCMSQVLNNF